MRMNTDYGIGHSVGTKENSVEIKFLRAETTYAPQTKFVRRKNLQS